jgi:hypothetical protein
MGDDDDHYAPSAGIAPKGDNKGHDHLQSMDESGQGPRRAVAEAVARPLGVQPSIKFKHHCSLLLQIGQPLGYSKIQL